MKPLVSVIIPNYNRAIYIEDCIQSVYKQSHRPIELIIVDDGSTDASIRIIKECQARLSNNDEFKILILEQKNSGAPRARNYGYEKSKGSYIQWLDSDDLLLPNKIESQLKAFNEDTELVYSRAHFFNEVPSKLMEKYWGHIPVGDSSDYFEFPWQTMCALYKKNAIQKYGLWKEDILFQQDWEFSMRYKIKAKVKFLNVTSSLYRHHKGDRVGKNLSIQKINSLTSNLINIYNLSKDYNLIDSYLKKRYFSRLTYCFLQSGVLGGNAAKMKVWKKLFEINWLKAILMVPFIFMGQSIFRYLLQLKKGN